MSERRLWTEDEVLIALALYEVTPLNKINARNPAVIRLARILGRSRGAVDRKLCNILALDKSRVGPKGFANGSKVDKIIFDRYQNPATGGTNLKRLYEDVERLCLVNPSLEEVKDVLSMHPHRSDESVYMTRYRNFQDYFRNAVLANCRESCVISHCSLPGLIEAAHIMPWSEYPDYRMDIANGIALNPLLHRAFDLDLLGISPDGKVVFSEAMRESEEFFEESLVHFDGRIIDFSLLKTKVNQDFLGCRFERFQQSPFY